MPTPADPQRRVRRFSDSAAVDSMRWAFGTSYRANDYGLYAAIPAWMMASASAASPQPSVLTHLPGSRSL